MARALLDAALLYVAAGRGDTAALGVLPQVRRWWETEGLIALLSASAAIDLRGDAGDLDGAIAIHDEMVDLLTRLWRPGFQARLRVSALLIGQLATHAAQASTAERRRLLERGEAAARWPPRSGSGRRLTGSGGPEAHAWAARADAELLRLRWLAGGGQPDLAALQKAWAETVRRFEDYGHAFEAARSRARLARGAGGSRRSQRPGAGGARPLRRRRRGSAPRPCWPSCEPLLGGPRTARSPGCRRRAPDATRARDPRRSSRWAGATSRSAPSCSSAPRLRASTSPTSWPSSARLAAARRWRWPASAACSTETDLPRLNRPRDTPCHGCCPVSGRGGTGGLGRPSFPPAAAIT